MKRILSFILAALIVLVLVPFSVSAASEDAKIYGPNTLIGTVELSFTGMIGSLAEEKGEVFVRGTVPVGSYKNNKLQAEFVPEGFSITDYNYVKFMYRTDSPEKKLDISSRSSVGESWFNKAPELVGDGKWHELVINTREITGGYGAIPIGENDVRLVFKPFGPVTVDIKKESYFDIKYIACFKSEKEAKAYVFSTSDDKPIEIKTETIVTEQLTEPAVTEKAEEPVKAEEITDPQDYKIYGPDTLISTVELSFTGFRGNTANDGVNYVNGVVEPGSYPNNKLQVEFVPEGFSITDYNFVKIAYKTDSPEKRVDVSSRSSVGESWMNRSPELIGDGKWQELIVNTHDITGGHGAIPIGETGVRFILKPFGSATAEIKEQSYFDIRYIACFKSEAAAKAYVFKAEDDTLANQSESNEYFYEIADKATIDGYMKTMDEMIKNIENSSTSVTVSGKKYYVSTSGSDDNDGLSPEKPWKSIEKVNNFKFNDGDGVFFKRGDTWRVAGQINAKSGVAYSAYGSGAKPKFIFSIDASGKASWIPADKENLYVYSKALSGERDVGAIIFDGGRAWGIQTQKTREGNRLEIGRVFNGIKWIDSATGAFSGGKDLCEDLEFYHDWDSNKLYLYCEGGNPGERFNSIEIADKGNGITLVEKTGAQKAENIVIDNLELFGAGSHGVGGGSVNGVTVSYCIFKWIGGSVQGRYIFDSNYGVRYGNAVEAYGSAENYTIHDCFASQIYDCCWTAQFSAATLFDNIKVYNNVSEYCNSGLEFWQGEGTVKNVDLYNNYTRYNGYGWSHQRSNKGGNFFYGGPGQKASFENCHVRNNVNVFASSNALLVGSTGVNQYNFHDNTYIMENNLYLGGISQNPGQGTGNFVDKGVPYNEINVKRVTASGFEKGGKFYYTEPGFYADDMYDLYNPGIGADLFSDIADNFWGRGAVDYVALKGYFNGVSADKFSPNGTMTRAMLVTVLSRIAGESASGVDATFTDINKAAWYAPGVAWAEKAGIVNAGGKFRPDVNATREELADMLYRYALYMNKKTDLSGAKDFADMAKVSAAYVDGIKFCTVNGIIGGYEDGTVRPHNSATRAEVATMIKRFENYLALAPIDIQKAVASAQITLVKGDALKKMLDNTGVRATLETDGRVKFVPFLEKALPEIKVLDQLNRDINLAKHPYVVIKFDGKLNSDTVLVAVKQVRLSNGRYDDLKTRAFADISSGAVILDMSQVIAGIDQSNYEDNLALCIYPWGEAEITLDKSEYFTISELVLCDNADVAQALAG